MSVVDWLALIGLTLLFLLDIAVSCGLGRCTIYHRWGKWQEYTVTVRTKFVNINRWTGERTDGGSSEQTEHWQARQCDRCGFAKRRRQERA